MSKNGRIDVLEANVQIDFIGSLEHTLETITKGIHRHLGKMKDGYGYSRVVAVYPGYALVQREKYEEGAGYNTVSFLVSYEIKDNVVEVTKVEEVPFAVSLAQRTEEALDLNQKDFASVVSDPAVDDRTAVNTIKTMMLLSEKG